ncbi:protein-glutamate O-methyltransferase CheR [Bremerella sp. JC817]|uniref:CheR family methyltransferase n=1 Tax=Bremerella sp. JC817 TaxID=3231756 RepID=UPI00345974FF
MALAAELISEKCFGDFKRLIYEKTGISLNESKRCLLSTRLSKRLRTLGIDEPAEYFKLVTSQGSEGPEMQELVNCITTNKTDFMREPHHFRFLTERCFPALTNHSLKGGPRKLRIWCAASSNGHEPYSLAMTVRDYPAFDSSWDIRILASDIDTRVLSKASEGVYPADELSVLEKTQLHRNFDRGTGSQTGKVRAKRELRDLITFRQINLIESSWPIQTKFDVIFCRNVMIYFDLPTQRKVVEHLIRYLKPGGFLMLGHSESIQWTPCPLRSLGQTIFQLG